MTKTTLERLNEQRQIVKGARDYYERAKALLADEPTRAHEENLQEAKSDLTFVTNHQTRLERQLEEESPMIKPSSSRRSKHRGIEL